MTLVIGVLALADGDLHGSPQLIAARLNVPAPDSEIDPVFRLEAPLDRPRWSGIVIHHLGLPSGDADSVHRLHLGYGYEGLGYHFLIGNGNGLGDGTIQMGYRWGEQLPGAHVIGAGGQHHNLHSIGICLVGNGDRRPFSDRQHRSLVSLVRRLQQELGIPAEAVRLHRDLADETTSPGRFFTAARFREQLLD